MNQHVRMHGASPTTQAAEGLQRRRFSVAEIEAMVKAGILEESERFELIGGEVVPMSPKGIRHELVKAALNRFWGRRCPESVHFNVETTFRLDESSFVEPDFVFYRAEDGLENLKPSNALLAVEVSDSSLAYDLGRKTRIYASFGVREVWVVDAIKLVTHVHAKPGLAGYSDVRDIGPGDPLGLPFAPEVAVVLRELDLR